MADEKGNRGPSSGRPSGYFRTKRKMVMGARRMKGERLRLLYAAARSPRRSGRGRIADDVEICGIARYA